MAEISINAATVKIYGRVRNEKMKVRESGLQRSYKQHYVSNKQLRIQISEILLVALQSLVENRNYRDL